MFSNQGQAVAVGRLGLVFDDGAMNLGWLHQSPNPRDGVSQIRLQLALVEASSFKPFYGLALEELCPPEDVL